jgi:molecular chaperone DnaK (HSP70)
MRYVKEQADNLTGKPIKKVVLSVPSFVNEQGKEELKESFKSSGLDIAEFITESASAGYAYNIDKNEKVKNFIVFNFSGLNFSLSYLTKKDNTDQTKETKEVKENNEPNTEVKRDIFETKYEIFDYSLGGEVN